MKTNLSSLNNVTATRVLIRMKDTGEARDLVLEEPRKAYVKNALHHWVQKYLSFTHGHNSQCKAHCSQDMRSWKQTLDSWTRNRLLAAFGYWLFLTKTSGWFFLSFGTEGKAALPVSRVQNVSFWVEFTAASQTGLVGPVGRTWSKLLSRCQS